MKPVIVLHHHEITLKGHNRRFFELQLLKNIRLLLKEYPAVNGVHGGYGRFVVKMNSDDQMDSICETLSHVFGISNVCAGINVDQDLALFKSTAEKLLDESKFRTIRVITKRSDKNFPIRSMEVSAEVGGHLCEHFGVRADMTNPDAIIHVEIADGTAFIYRSKLQGSGGLPVGVSGRVVSLLSAGFDSPVASWRMMRRGANVSFVHFHSMPYTSRDSLDQVRQLVNVLTRYQYRSRLYLVAFADLQNQIVLQVPPPLRIIFYRRMMIRIAEIVARKEKAEALVTGEAVGQVASQTLRNIRVIDEAATFPILRPLAGMDKEETMEQARKIGTFDISKEPFDDCCSFLAPRAPETWAKIEDVLEIEKTLNVREVLAKTLKGITVEEFRYPLTVVNEDAAVSS